ncbi:Periplasmic nitrate reductase [Gossypium arboreum]|uniref:Periplasmic nitrate reductase n=1 Tax=Gossypium arboreum TaxID=29729 RepID=A0A0B0MC22_GOSAR|nr:Periplasmic nitrate reductase [Gossypium arboreum]
MGRKGKDQASTNYALNGTVSHHRIKEDKALENPRHFSHNNGERGEPKGSAPFGHSFITATMNDDLREGDKVSDGSYAKVRVRGCALALGVRCTEGGRGIRGLRAGRTALKARRGC